MLLMWSGGADSTFVLAERLKAKQPVRTLSIVQPQFFHNEEQRRARALVVNHYKRKKISWPHAEFVVSHKYPHGNKHCFNAGGVLPGIWIGIAAAYLNADEDLGIAYIKGDNAIHWLGSIRAAFDWLQIISQRKGKLILPVEWTSKAQILDGLKRHHLLRKTWWCESPKNGKKCGTCSPCMTHKTAEWVLKTKNDFKLHGNYGIDGNGVHVVVEDEVQVGIAPDKVKAS